MLKNLIKFGNLKLPNTTAIFNITSGHDCPSLKLGFCQAYDNNKKLVCYAIRDEHMYKNPRFYREKQSEYWKTVNAETFYNELISINNKKRIKLKALRFNESGDFISQDCVDKVETIARLLKKHKIKVYCYTARKDLNYSKIKHTIINCSGFNETNNVFKFINSLDEKPDNFELCKMDCTICSRCLINGSKTAILKH